MCMRLSDRPGWPLYSSPVFTIRWDKRTEYDFLTVCEIRNSTVTILIKFLNLLMDVQYRSRSVSRK